MTYSARILLDSISPTSKRITTFEITFPRCVFAEAEIHRVIRGWGGNVEELVINNLGINVDENLSRNSASSRAIPINKMLQRVKENPFIPEKWGMPTKGMGAKEYYDLGTREHRDLSELWNRALLRNIEIVEDAINIGNKEDLNRLLEPFMWHTVIVTATEFDNFFKLKTNENAQYEIRKIADLMYDAYHAFENWGKEISTNKCEHGTIKVPQKLKVGEWHCPLVSKDDFKPIMLYLSKLKKFDEYYADGYRNFTSLLSESEHNGSAEELLIDFIEIQKKISVARCARVSYLTHDGKRDIEKDLELFERLRTSGHWSPFGHVATPYFKDRGNDFQKQFYDSRFENQRNGNFIGWKQMRKEFADENCVSFRKE